MSAQRVIAPKYIPVHPARWIWPLTTTWLVMDRFDVHGWPWGVYFCVTTFVAFTAIYVSCIQIRCAPAEIKE